MSTIEQAANPWAYQEIEDNWKAGRDVWTEVTEDFYYQALEVLPPIYRPGGFMVGEAYTHTASDAIHAGFVQTCGRFFARCCAVREFGALATTLRHSLEG